MHPIGALWFGKKRYTAREVSQDYTFHYLIFFENNQAHLELLRDTVDNTYIPDDG